MRTVCLIGRPNTGKSSLFNAMVKEQKSIIMDMPGITRDRIYGVVTYNDKSFSIIDTGGLEIGDEDFKKDILMQATFAIDEADIVLFVVDGTTELNGNDYYIRDMLIKANKEVIVVINKIDNEKRKDEIYRFYELGFENIMMVSATHKKGLKELLNRITKDLKEEINEYHNHCYFSVIGRPNVGKSSLVNAMLNKERSIVSSIAGTTRDAIDTTFKYHGEEYTIIDTAGMRKQGKIYENVEKYSLLRSLKAMERSDVCLLVIDAQEGIIEHDKHIAGMALNLGKALVLCVNKIDAIQEDAAWLKSWQEKIKYEFQFMPYVPIVFVSARDKKRISLVMPEIIKAYENHKMFISSSLLNDVISDAVALHMPPSYKGKRLKIYFVNQEDSEPPKFTFHVNDKKLVHFSYERYLENKIRENFDLTGTPIIFKFKNRNE